MRLLLMSDLHIEFRPMELPPADLYDVVLLAGDVHTQGRSAQWAAGHFQKPVMLVAGNHEFYKSSWHKTLKRLGTPSGENVHFLERQTIVLEGVRFIGAVGWSDFEGTGNPHLAALEARALMNDYKLIRLEPNYSRLTPEFTRRVAQETRAWLRQQIAEPFAGKTVVITHFPPLMQFVPDFGSPPNLRAAYGNDWVEFVGMNIDLWVFGHTHHPIDEVLEGTRFVSNPRGYPNEGVAFDSQLVVTL